MGFFNKREKEKIQQTPELEVLNSLIKNQPMTREKALSLPVVSGAVELISNAVACMPVRLYRIIAGRVEELYNDNRTKLLNTDTNDTLDPFQMKKAMVADYLLGKGGYCYIERSKNETTGLHYVQDIYVEIWKSYDPIYKWYKILVMGKEYRDYNFVKLLRNTKDGASGVGLTTEVGKALESAYKTLIYQLTLVSKGGNKKGFLKSQVKLSQESIDKLKEAWKSMYSSDEDSDNVVMLNNGLEFQEASNTSVEMQINESKKTFNAEINSMFHIYPNNFLQTFKEAILPIMKAFTVALNRDLLLEREKRNYFFLFDPKEILEVAQKERYESYKLAKETGFMTLNEIRKAENMEPVEGLDVVNVGLGAVLYDTSTHKYYTPNTGSTMDTVASDDVLQKETDMLESHELVTEFDESGNSSAV